MSTSDSPTPSALEGIRVLDLTTRLGEGAGRVFADLGAEVIKIEPPGGCEARFTPPFDEDLPGDPNGSLFWRVWGLGKRSIVLDLESPDDRGRFIELVRTADVLLESFAPGTLAGWGLGSEALCRENPQLVYVSLTPFGQSVPDAASPATDLILSAAGGLLGMMGDKDRPPIPVGFGETSMHGALQAAADAILALYERNRSGRGQHLDTSMQAAVVWALLFVTGYAAFDRDPPTFGDDRSEAGRRPLEIMPGLPNPVVAPCKDGHVVMTLVLGAQGNHGFGQAMKWAEEAGVLDSDLCGREWSSWLDDLPAGRLSVEDAARGLGQLLDFLSSQTKSQIQEQAVARKMLIAPAYTAADLYADPQLASRDFWQDVQGLRYAGPFAQLSRTPIRYRAAAPELAADQELLDSLARRPRVLVRESGRERRPIFEGLKVADLGWIAAGPLITKDLANLGATVVSVESESRLDTLRFIPPWKDDIPHVDGGHPFANMNQSKYGIACNHAVPESKLVLERILAWADVVVENFTPGTAERLGFGWEQVRARRPDALMLSTCMRGQTGPEATHTGFGIQGAALAGYVACTGWPDRPPQPPWGAYTDFISPRYALAALGAALLHRDRTGEGQYIDVSQVEASIHSIEPMLLDYQVNGRTLERPGLTCARACPHCVLATRGTERYLAIAVETPAQWQGLREVVPGVRALGDGLDALAERTARRWEIEDELRRWAAQEPAPAAAQRLRDAGVPAYVVLRASDLHADPQLAARGFFVELDHPHIGRSRFDGAVTLFSETPMRPTHAGPTLGQHTWEALRDVLGFDEDEIANLAAAQALT